MTDAWSARIRADGISRATVSPGACRDVLSVSPTTPHSGFQPRNFVPRSWHSGTPLSSQIATSPYGGPGSRYGITMDRRPSAHKRLRCHLSGRVSVSPYREPFPTWLGLAKLQCVDGLGGFALCHGPHRRSPVTGLLTLGSGPARFQAKPPACYRAS